MPGGEAPRLDLPGTWTPEQAEEFRKAWEEHWVTARKHQVRWLPPGSAATERRQQVALHLKWAEDGQPRQELFGPWTAMAEDDLSHMEAAQGFLGDFCRATGIQPDEATAVLILDAEEWLREREQQQGSDDG